FLSSAGIVTLVTGITLALTHRSANAAAEKSIARALSVSEARVLQLLAAERDVLAGRLRAYAASPEYRGSFDAANPEYFDYVAIAAEETGAQWVQVIDREGTRLAKSDAPTAPAVSVIGSQLIRDALDGRNAESFGVAGDTALVQYVVVPIVGANDRIIGALMGAKYVNDSTAAVIRDATDTDVLFFMLDTLEQPRFAVATPALRSANTRILAALDGSAAPANGVELAGGPDSTQPSRNEELDLNGEHFVTRRATVTAASGAPVGGFVAMRSREKELSASGYTDLRKTLLLSGGGGMLLALLVAGLTTRQVVRPVRTLANATRRAAEGDYAAEIPEGGSDEIGTLASAFRRLLADLKDKQALVDFLSAATPATRSAAFTASSPTMQLPTGDIKVLSPGQTFGNRYEIRSVLGVGGMGMVYKANDRELGEVLAIKTLKPEIVAADSNALERFKREIKLARRIAHRNVVRTYDLGEIGGQYYITMEYVEGTSLKDLIQQRRRLPASVVLPIAKQLCRALEVSHEEGVIHRDIKPQNMVVQADGVLKVMDFGIARLATRAADGGHTQAGMVVGTPEYMAPEQLMGDELDPRADLYATGVVLYECLVGTVPHTADTPITLIAKVLEEQPAPPAALHPDIPREMSELVIWAMAKDRENRPRNAAELHTRLDQIVLP
ncbi:MAG TPA: protein kinase, partial [Gemmatimonadaceae bacterium]|nr:protein kinase [Gemmatimonadaceae bacterium]